MKKLAGISSAFALCRRGGGEAANLRENASKGPHEKPILTGGALRAADPGSIRWIKNLKQASEVAQEANRPMLIDFWADWCAPCKVMDAKVYTNSALAEAVGRTIVPVRINFDMQPEIARRYNVQTIPQVVFTDSYGTELTRRRGYVDANGLSAALNTLPADLSELNRVDRVLQASKNDFESLLEMGGRLKAAGFFDSSSVYYARALKQDEARKNPAKREFILEEMGLDYLELKDSKRAAQIFERCLKEFPSSERRPDAMLNLARAYLLGEQNEKARKLLRALIAEFPESEISRKGEPIVNLR